MKRRDSDPMRMCCERDDGTPRHLALAIELPLGLSEAAEAIGAIGAVRCPCGGALVMGAAVATPSGRAFGAVLGELALREEQHLALREAVDLLLGDADGALDDPMRDLRNRLHHEDLARVNALASQLDVPGVTP